MANYKVSIDLDNLTLGDMERLEAGRVTDMLAVFDRHIGIEGVEPEDVPATIREWTIEDLRVVGDAIAEQVEAQQNPTKSGKN